MKRVTLWKGGVFLATLTFMALTLGAGTRSVPGRVLNFNHNLHLDDAGLECVDCHTEMSTLKAGQRGIPDHDICSTCHEVEDDENCGTCHLDPDNPVAVPAPGGLYEGFAHASHISAELECANCHDLAREEDAVPALPAMADCQTCHLQRQAELDCGVCHLGESPEPIDHQAVAWLNDHGLEASLGTSDCAQCHDQASCDVCHQGIGPWDIPHSDDWLFRHSAEVAFGAECLVCHETRESCTNCHRSMIPMPHSFGPAWANDVNGGEHQRDAEAFMDACISCHDIEGGDPTCARCHE